MIKSTKTARVGIANLNQLIDIYTSFVGIVSVSYMLDHTSTQQTYSKPRCCRAIGHDLTQTLMEVLPVAANRAAYSFHSRKAKGSSSAADRHTALPPLTQHRS